MSELMEKKQVSINKKTKEMSKEAVVYIGPDISGVKQYTTYNAGIPDALKDKIKEHPFFNAFVIPVGKLAWANAEIEKQGSALNILYQKASRK